jgi:hypothetical protein
VELYLHCPYAFMTWCSVKAQGQLYLNLRVPVSLGAYNRLSCVVKNHRINQLRIAITGVRFPARTGNFSLHHRVLTCSGIHPASHQLGTGGSSPGIEQPVREADHSPPSSAEVKNAWSFTSSPPVYLHGVIVMYRGYFTFTLLYVQPEETPLLQKNRFTLFFIL